MASKQRALAWSTPALRDLREIRAYVALDKPAAAKKLADRIRDSALMLRDNPLAGRVVPELAALGLREVIAAPYRVVYALEARRVVVLRVWHGRRDLTALDVEATLTPESKPKSGTRRKK